MDKSKAHCSYILQKPLYDNCQLLDSEGILLSTCNRKKVQWYVDRGLGTIVKENPVTLQLNFAKKYEDRDSHSKMYYCHHKNNICVVCGYNASLLRKYIVPAEYRRFLEGTSHSSHDILLFCRSCHAKFDEAQQTLRKSLCKEYGVPENMSGKFLVNEAIKKVQEAGKALKKYRQAMPESRINQLSGEIMRFYKIEHLNDEEIERASQEVYLEPNTNYEPHGKQLMEAFKNVHGDSSLVLRQFEKRWRQLFLDSMKPQNLPLDWSVMHGFDLIDSEE